MLPAMLAPVTRIEGKRSHHRRTNSGMSVPTRASFADGTGFDEVAVGKGGAGFLWEQHLEEREAARTSLAQPILGDQEDGNSSDEASITTVEDMASDAIDPPEEAAEVG